MTNKKSRPDQWAEAISRASDAVSTMMGHLEDLETAISELTSLQEEYSEWKDNLPENLQSSPLAEKLEEVCDLGIEDIASNVRGALEDAETLIDEVGAVELPKGFGRD